MNYTLDKNRQGSLDDVVGEIIFEEPVKNKSPLHKIIKNNIHSFVAATIASIVSDKILALPYHPNVHSLVISILTPTTFYMVDKDRKIFYEFPGYFLGAVTGIYLAKLYLK